jgi:hypothetical protein
MYGTESSYQIDMLYEDLVCEVCGDNWRYGSRSAINSAWGVAIVRSILDGVAPRLKDLCDHLGVDRGVIIEAHRLLSLNGAFLRNRIYADSEALEGDDMCAWRYYAGMACGATGPYRPDFDPSAS